MDAQTGEVVIKSTIENLREQVGQENLFTLTFVAKEIGDGEAGAASMAARMMPGGELEHMVDGLHADSDLPNEQSDPHNRYIVNDHFYDDESNTLRRRHSFRNSPPHSSSLTSDLLAIDSKISKRMGDETAGDRVGRVEDSVKYKTNEKQSDVQAKVANDAANTFRANRAESLASLQSINHLVLNRIPLKSTPVNVPPLNPALFSRRMLSDEPAKPQLSGYDFGPFEPGNPFRPLINLTTREIKRVDDAPVLGSPKFSTKTMGSTSKPTTRSSTTTSKPSTRPSTTTSKLPTTRSTTTSRPPTTSKPSTTSRPAIAKPMVVTSKPVTMRPTTESPWRPITSANVLSPVISRPIKSTAPLIAQNAHSPSKWSSGQVPNVNLANDNLVADEHYIVNNLTSIGLMDENFKPENLVEPESSAEISRFNNERATMMNAVLSEISGASRTETEITIGFVILQISNHAPEFPLVKPNFTTDQNAGVFLMYGQIDDDLKPNSVVQFENEILVQDQDHGLNGTFDLQLSDPTKTFDLQPKTGYRNQTIQILVSNSSQLALMGNRVVNLKVSHFFFVF